MQQDHGHSLEEVAERLGKSTKVNFLSDAIYGAIDGAVTTFAIVAGVEGAGLPSHVIIALGAANIIADGFSMAASNYSGTKAELDERARIIETEERHIANYPDGELEELRQILARHGLSGRILADASAAIASNKEKWIGLMLTEEYGLTRDAPAPLKAAIITFIAFLLAGSIPLLPFAFGVPDPFRVSITTTLVTFFLIGTAKSRWSLTSWWRSGLETLLIGGTAALLAYFVGTLFTTG